MTTTYSGTATFPASIELPQDSVDKRSAAVINPPLQGCFDAATYLHARDMYYRVVAIDDDSEHAASTTQAVWASYCIASAIGVAAAQQLVFDAVLTGTGNSLSVVSEFRAAYALNGGSITAIPGARAMQIISGNAQTNISVMGMVTPGAGTVDLYLQVRNNTTAGHVASKIYGPICWRVAVRKTD